MEKKTSNKKRVNQKEHERNNRVIFSVIIIIFTLCLIAGISYAAFRYLKPGEKPNEVATGTLILNLDESMGEGISIEGAMPTSDEVGKTFVPYQFSVQNTGTLNSRYRIRLVDDTTAITADGCQNKLLSRSQVRYMLTKNNTNGSVDFLSGLTSNIIDTGIINAGNTNTYQLRLWIDSGITNPSDINGKHMHVKIVVDTIQETQDFGNYVQDGLKIWYDGMDHGNDPNVWKDLSGNGNDLTLSSFDHTGQSGWNHNGLVFDGVDDFGQVSYNTTFTPAITVDTTYIPTNNDGTFVWFFSDASNRDNYRLGGGYRKNIAYIKNNSGQTQSYSYSHQAGEKAHVVTILTPSTKKIQIYLNEKLVINATYPGELQNNINAGLLYLGRWHQYSSMTMYSFRVYNRALTVEEIHQNYAMDISKYQ